MDVGVFIRVSTLDQAKGESPKIHEERARMFAKSKDWNIVRVYDLAGVSGKSTRYNSETQIMLDDIASGKIEGLIFSQLSRLARNTQELLYYADYFEKHNASLISLNESIDTSSSSGKFFYTILGALSTWERENNHDRIMASIETRRSMGKFTGGQVSYGYKIENSRLVIHKEEAVVREMMFDLYLKHRRRATVARILNEKGFRTRRNNKWRDTVIYRLLKNTDAKGIRRANYKRRPTPDNPSNLKPKNEWIYEPCPAIISEEKWDAVNAIMTEQANSVLLQPNNLRVNTFTGYIKCHNGHPMAMHPSMKKYSCPKCKVRIVGEDLEHVFKTRMRNFTVSEEELSEYTKTSEHELKLKKGVIETTQKKKLGIVDKQDKLIELSMAGQIPTQGFKKHYEPLDEQKEQLENNLKLLENQLNEMKLAVSSQNDVIEKSRDLYERWDTLEKAEKRFIVESVTNEILFDGKNLTFKLKQIAPLSAFKELVTNAPHFGTI